MSEGSAVEDFQTPRRGARMVTGNEVLLGDGVTRVAGACSEAQ